jgi:predicted phosphodiesterase
MRLAIISDIHGNLVALEAVLADLRARSPDVTINLGDCVTSPLWPRETFELLATLDLPTVRGNHDRWITGTSSCSRSSTTVHRWCNEPGACSATIGWWAMRRG